MDVHYVCDTKNYDIAKSSNILLVSSNVCAIGPTYELLLFVSTKDCCDKQYPRSLSLLLTDAVASR